MEDESEKAHGVLLWNAHAQVYQMLPQPGLVWQSAGGLLDVFILLGDSPEHVLQLYASLLGQPALPPLWALGFHLGDMVFI